MSTTKGVEQILEQVAAPDTKMGDLRKIAKDIKKDHELAMNLWQTANFHARLLAMLILDVKQLDAETVNQLLDDTAKHPTDQKLQLSEWFMANQLSKNKNTIAMLESWENSERSLQRRLFWYYQARLRWTGQKPPPNTEELLQKIEQGILHEEPEVQWAMNFTAAQIGVFMPEHRERCIQLGLDTGLYKDEVVPRGCVPSYLPEFIPIQVSKIK
ncbi:MAG: DNA alkylation repair protein [Weeksellaceae bacterium]|nr:DNA alkylation repair protein [Weeksellaceae bacterium]